jgi:hypothetical protein
MFAGAAILAFGAALSAPFDFDDLPAIVDNWSIRSLWPLSGPLSPPGLGTAVSGRPVANFSFALNYAANRWFGVIQGTGAPAHGETIGYHAVNILLHVTVALLLFGVIRRTIRSARIPDDWRDSADRIGFVAAGLWMIHPIQTDAVDYVSQRTELLVSLWYMLTLYAALRSWNESNGSTDAAGPSRARRWAAVSAASCLAGMGTKEVMLTAPFALLLFDRAFLYSSLLEPWRVPLRRALYAALFATMSWAVYLITHGGRAATVGLRLGITSYEYLYSQGWAIAHYLQLVVWPTGFTYDYGQSPVRDWSGIPGAVILGRVSGRVHRRVAETTLALARISRRVVLSPARAVIQHRPDSNRDCRRAENLSVARSGDGGTCGGG